MGQVSWTTLSYNLIQSFKAIQEPFNYTFILDYPEDSTASSLNTVFASSDPRLLFFFFFPLSSERSWESFSLAKFNIFQLSITAKRLYHLCCCEGPSQGYAFPKRGSPAYETIKEGFQDEDLKAF